MIRNSAKALIEHDRAVLLQVCEFDGQTVYLLPGGTQEFGESLGDTVLREVYEETGLRVRVDYLLWIREYIARNYGVVEGAGHHVVESIFRCTIEPGAKLSSGTLPDMGQVAVRWVPLSELPRLTMWPETIRQLLITGHAGGSALAPSYLGDCP